MAESPKPPTSEMHQNEIVRREVAEQALGHSQEIFRLLVDAVADYAIFALDPKGNILTWNAGARRLKGYERDEVIGTHFSRFYTPEDLARNHPEHELKIATETGKYEEEGWRVRKDGTRFWANVLITALRDPGGELRGFAKVTRDLSQRKMEEDRLREGEERFRLLVDSVRDYAIFMLDADGKVATWNQGAKRLKGYDPSDIIGKHFSIFYTPEDLALDKPGIELREATRTGRYEDTGWRVRKDGSRFWANVVLTAIRDQNGLLRGFAKVTRDLTERKKAEDELQRSYQMLEQRVQERTAELEQAKVEAENAVRVRDDFLSIASHELKTPLTSLKLQTQTRKRKLAKGVLTMLEPQNFKEMLEDDERQINRINRLVDDMLDITRLTSGKFSLDRETTDLCTTVEEVLNRFSAQLEAANTDVHLEGCTELIGHWDRYRIEQVFTNLLTNAIKYGAGKPIRVSVSRHGGFAKLAVKDEGIGIAKADQERIFEQFERAVSANDVSGLGLGLYIVKQIIDAHGGKIYVESEPGKGSTFIVELPVD